MDYFSFEDVMKELELSEEDLKRMVSEGELRAFRDENKMKFKKEDVDNLKKGRITEPTIILPSTPGGSQDETVLDLDIGQETASLSAETSESRPVTARPPPRPAESDDLLVNADEEKGPEQEETFIEEESDTGLTTEPLKLADEVEAAETVESTEAVTEEVAQPRRGSRARRAGAAVPMATEEEIEKRRAHPVWTFFLIAAFALAGYSGFFVMDLLKMENGRQEQPSGLTGGVAKWTLDQFWGDGSWTKFHTKEYIGGENPPYTVGDKPVPTTGADWYKGASFTKPDRAPSQWTQAPQ